MVTTLPLTNNTFCSPQLEISMKTYFELLLVPAGVIQCSFTWLRSPHIALQSPSSFTVGVSVASTTLVMASSVMMTSKFSISYGMCVINIIYVWCDMSSVGA